MPHYKSILCKEARGRGEHGLSEQQLLFFFRSLVLKTNDNHRGSQYRSLVVFFKPASRKEGVISWLPWISLCFRIVQHKSVCVVQARKETGKLLGFLLLLISSFPVCLELSVLECANKSERFDEVSERGVVFTAVKAAAVEAAASTRIQKRSTSNKSPLQGPSLSPRAVDLLQLSRKTKSSLTVSFW